MFSFVDDIVKRLFLSGLKKVAGNFLRTDLTVDQIDLSASEGRLELFDVDINHDVGLPVQLQSISSTASYRYSTISLQIYLSPLLLAVFAISNLPSLLRI